MTNILGETSDGRKKTLRSPKVQPEVVIYDVELTFTLPPRLSATSGMNASLTRSRDCMRKIAIRL